jgi:cytochrome c556
MLSFFAKAPSRLPVLQKEKTFLEEMMKKRTAITLFCLATTFAVGANADDQQDFVAWMKTTGGTMGKLRKEVEAKAFSDVAKDAATLQDVFKKVEDYFAKSNTTDAVQSAQGAQAAVKTLAAAAKSENADEVAAGLKGVMGSCSGCHNAHREKLPEGGYKIK